MPMYDYQCMSCGHEEEDVMPSNTKVIPCSKCGEKSERVFVSCAKALTTIIPSYPGCKKHRAGYVHTHGDRPRTRVQGVGFSSS